MVDSVPIYKSNYLTMGGKNPSSLSRWERAIARWQSPALDSADVPDWLKSAAFNELYYLADGGTQRLQMDEEEELDESDPRRAFGRFCYLESHEYRMFNTYDVHFYASPALVDLFPGLELSLQMDFVRFTAAGDGGATVKELYGGRRVGRSPEYSVPHDLGDPEDEPFVRVNAYRIHDVSQWKDLPLKFVLSSWRDTVLLSRPGQEEKVRKCAEFLSREAWPVCQQAMERALLRWDADGDGLIENSGRPDQTYDTWRMDGPSAYCNSLWLAALRGHVELGRRIDRGKDVEKFGAVMDQ